MDLFWPTEDVELADQHDTEPLGLDLDWAAQQKRLLATLYATKQASRHLDNRVACQVALDRLVRKSAVSSFILEKVDEMKVLSSTMAGKEKLDAELTPWRVSVHGLD